MEMVGSDLLCSDSVCVWDTFGSSALIAGQNVISSFKYTKDCIYFRTK